jgi:hypothetical protein
MSTPSTDEGTSDEARNLAGERESSWWMSTYCKAAETDGPTTRRGVIRSDGRGLVLRSRSPGCGWSIGVPGHGLDA